MGRNANLVFKRVRAIIFLPGFVSKIDKTKIKQIDPRELGHNEPVFHKVIR